MRMTFIMFIFGTISLLITTAAVVYLFILIVRALKKYINSQDVRKEKSEKFSGCEKGKIRDAEVIGRSVKKVPYRQ